MEGRWRVVLGLIAAAFACSNGPRDTPSHEGSDRPVAVQPVELGEIIHTAPIAFRPSGNGVMARGRHHAVAVSTDHVTFTPHLDGRSAGVFGFRTVIAGTTGVTTAFEAVSATSVSRTVQGVDERIENDDSHIEQVWTFPTRPAGSITVRVEVDGYTFADETAAGLRFVDAGSGRSVRYGHATWIDARGSRTSVTARWSGRSIDLTIDDKLLAASEFPATLDPIILVEELEPDAPVLVPDIRGQGTASVATSATTSVAVFENGTTFQIGDAVRGMYMVRLGLDGVPLDACGTPVSSDTNRALIYGAPVVTYAGGIFLVAWMQSNACNFEVRARRLDATGTFLDAADLVVASGSSCSFAGQLRVAFDGSRFLLVWIDYATGKLTGATVDPNGTVGPELQIATVDGSIAAVAGLLGGGWSVGWIQPGPRNVFLTRLAADGTIVDPGTMVPDSGSATSPTMASSGTDLVVAWTGVGGIQAQRLDALGSLVGAPFNVTSGPGERARVAWDGSAWFFVWEGGPWGGTLRDVYARRVSASGTLLGSSDTLVFEKIMSGNVPWVGPTVGGVVTAQSILPDPEGGPTYKLSTFRRFDADGVALDAAPVPIVRCANREDKPSVAWNGSHYLVVWEDDRNGPGTDLYGVRIAADGTVLDETAIAISTAPFAQTDPVVISDGARFFVVWEDFRAGAHANICGTFVDTAGIVSSPDGIPIHMATIHKWEPVVAAGGGRFFVAWESGSSEVQGRVLDSNAAGLGPAFLVAPFSGSPQPPRVSYGDNQFLVSFGRSARRYDVNGAAVGTAISVAPAFNDVGSLGASDEAWLYTFKGGSSFGGVSVRRVEFDGTFTKAAPTSIHAATAAWVPTAAWDGEQFLVVWQEAVTSEYAAPHALYAKRVTKEAEGVETVPVALTNARMSTSLGGVAAGPTGSFLVVFREWEAAKPYVNHRVRALVVSVDGSASGTPCASGTECRSGLCVDGVCCEVRCGDGVEGDCEACAVSAGGSREGICTAVAPGPVCRPATGECDVADVCDGTNRVCVPNETVDDGLECAGGFCSGGSCMLPIPDAGMPDAYVHDAATTDAYEPDAYVPDAYVPDAYVPDAATPDVYVPDAATPDAGTPDAGTLDASPPDAATHADAHVFDAFAPDAAVVDGDAAPMRDAPNADAPPGEGCGCQQTHQNGTAGIVWMTTLLLLTLRRRAPRGRPS